MVERLSFSRRLFLIVNYTALIATALVCILPLAHVLALSFSSNAAATSGYVKLWPVEFTLKSYEFVLSRPAFMKSLLVTLERVAIGLPLNLLLTILIAYPLSKESSRFKLRTAYVWYFVFTMLFSGGLIPTYMTVNKAGLLDSIWALVLPGAVPVFNVVLLLNFFRGLPKELEEAAFIDGAGHFRTLWKIYFPLSLPAIATIALFTTVGHWNSWFDGLIYMNSPDHYPLQSYLQTVIASRDMTLASSTDLELLAEVSDRTVKAAQIFMGALPILLVYPFLQRYFVKGIVLGSVKE
ncbi:carbohydrate ABC transporter permease [Cohnella hongkongensis]|uniref:Carbohydrate ABC transporter permease n=1 Tax=Cohnella hongkongensis TaxID=178337 RepID=A0ABV9F4H6_9BACL